MRVKTRALVINMFNLFPISVLEDYSIFDLFQIILEELDSRTDIVSLSLLYGILVVAMHV